MDDRENFYLDEAQVGYQEKHIFLGTDHTFETAFDMDYIELEEVSLDQSVKIELVPIEKLDEKLCLYYDVRYTDGTRGDRIGDWETGEILDSQGKPENN